MDIFTDSKILDNQPDLVAEVTRVVPGLPDSHADREIPDSEASDNDLGERIDDKFENDQTEPSDSCRTLETVLVPEGAWPTVPRFHDYVSAQILSPFPNPHQPLIAL